MYSGSGFKFKITIQHIALKYEYALKKFYMLLCKPIANTRCVAHIHNRTQMWKWRKNENKNQFEPVCSSSNSPNLESMPICPSIGSYGLLLIVKWSCWNGTNFYFIVTRIRIRTLTVRLLNNNRENRISNETKQNQRKREKNGLEQNKNRE